MSAQPSSLGTLVKLPGELRNQIYDDVFSPDPGPIPLLTAKLPESHLLLVSRQIHNETRKLHQEACVHFWSDSHFQVTLTPPHVPEQVQPAIEALHSMSDKVRAMNAHHLRQIRKLEIIFNDRTYKLYDPVGIWYCSSSNPNTAGLEWCILMPGSRRGQCYGTLAEAHAWLDQFGECRQIASSRGLIEKQILCFLYRHRQKLNPTRRERRRRSEVSLIVRDWHRIRSGAERTV
ncbi:hypothetical protein CLAFUW4_13279 [Fulvia fulva]|uniref:uncharacterized protein n=1 Tax=Passalora fulva TaxID=5499 RepID=UPI0028528D91|nr:uncharacterized protein CLAFUR5_20347 [Fulvia fulva]KAK4611801.1 hypothetical protein CLAFUR4_13284 [Fulvia fulva]KAK4612600.1 hypothetical protein CLAFUR0_13289 [Fulvia fulva]WMI39052.1 hypothetical protein CLAFUR5_20347 [Fulvia fulva]WPV21035.1 hypothetical protein CLAFUW4_13279 [Fulvia fulva]WPV36139.1 hypothetical protein CLAFUW7_13286 [Fulvia fulva]